MATQTATPSVTDLSVKTENIVYTRFLKATLNEKTQKTDFEAKVLRSASEDDVKEMEGKGYKKQADQTVITYRAGNPEGFSQIIADSEESTNIYNRGLAQKESNKMNALFGETDEQGNPTFQFSEEAYDSREKMNEITSRRNLSPNDKAIKLLRASGLPQVVIDQMIEKMLETQASLA
jgi:hypothetical protein